MKLLPGTEMKIVGDEQEIPLPAAVIIGQVIRWADYITEPGGVDEHALLIITATHVLRIGSLDLGRQVQPGQPYRIGIGIGQVVGNIEFPPAANEPTLCNFVKGKTLTGVRTSPMSGLWIDFDNGASGIGVNTRGIFTWVKNDEQPARPQ